MGRTPDDGPHAREWSGRPPTESRESDGTAASDDWEDRHARTTDAENGDPGPTVTFGTPPEECDWHVRHGHVRSVSRQ